MDHAEVSLAQIGQRHSDTSLRAALRAALAPLGGLGAFVSAGQKVLLKPNQTLFKNHLSGSTTSPRLLRVLAEECFHAGAREVWIAEASGHAQRTRKVMQRAGATAVLRQTGAHLIYLDEIAEELFDFGEDAGDLRTMPAPEILDRADVIINVPKAKTHFIDPISCACKNWVGVMPMSYRLALQRRGEPYYRGTALLLRRFRPHLTIVDGGVAGEGQGPGANTAFWWGWVLASTDPVAIDVTVARLFELDWQNLRMARAAADLGVGVYDPAAIELIGARLDEARRPVVPADPSVHRYPCHVIPGDSVNLEGTLGHWKTIADGWLQNGLWHLFTLRGKPTFLFGDAIDPEFEQHLAEGPYLVIDDSARDEYKYHPRTHYIPGNPVPQSYLQHEMVEAMGFGGIYQLGLKVYQKLVALRERLAVGRS